VIEVSPVSHARPMAVNGGVGGGFDYGDGECR